MEVKVKRTTVKVRLEEAQRFEMSMAVMFEVVEEVGAPELSLVVMMKRSL